MTCLPDLVRKVVAHQGGWLPFDRFMELALYTPGLGYYANASRKFGALPSSGSDFVTAPEMSPLFGRTLAAQVAQALAQTGAHEVWEFGAGSGALAQQLLSGLGELGVALRRYVIVELSASLRERQQTRLAAHGNVHWADAWPERGAAVVVGNEVLDAMPVKLLVRLGGQWHERGVVWHQDALCFADTPTELRPPLEPDGCHDYLTEIHPQAQAFVASLAERLERGAAFFFDYGFGEQEYYHPQRHMGTLMCHRGHQSDSNPLIDVGLKDITAHVDFTGIALAAQGAGLGTLGYTSQGRFLVNCGLGDHMAVADLPTQVGAQRLIAEHEMGELFKVLALHVGPYWDALGFRAGDRTHTL